jgi:hypothetical protein
MYGMIDAGLGGRCGLERETGIEPATFSLGSWHGIENKEYNESGDPLLAIKNTANLTICSAKSLMEHKRSTRMEVLATRRSSPKT